MYQSFIGLEIHIHLLSKTKAFCGCKAGFGDEPNTNVCPVCLGYPGVLPTVNEEAMRMAYTVARALNCDLAKTCYFDRKNYFYPDMTKNYQITQFYKPVGRGGYFEIEVGGEIKKIRIHDVHLEEDAGKMIHAGTSSLLDYNRAGSSLLEIVTEPDLVTGEDAEAFIRGFRTLVRHLGVCNGNMEEGSLRCDGNISINLQGKGLGIKTEVKNLNSSRFVKKALQYEIVRQKRVLDKGGKIIQETRLWDEAKNMTVSMRTKESSHDYRYFPEPDMPPFSPDVAFWDNLETSLIELPLHKKQRLIKDNQISADTAEFIVEDKAMADVFEKTIACGATPKIVANWLVGNVQSLLKKRGIAIEQSNISPARLAGTIEMVTGGKVSAKNAKEVLEAIIEEDKEPAQIVAEKGLEQILDDSEMDSWVEQAFEKNPRVIEDIKSGNTKVISFLVGQVMRFSKGKADPKIARDKIDSKLGL